ncbi:Regulator_of chromosome condensation 1/beta-lactamase-inhibitor protein II [Hexamita inflata]|uniref:Regulator of chromosome condensation 1/beta-lactamase-inhibitor protein II n=1 Tax=Hexamita inflata TaxID=28002 RepID=A0AA86U7S9_9EUKA|nr:Regulator of chromosome condensation 1/beta-lactamase-inhibitor protein II [Hexamita inflata]
MCGRDQNGNEFQKELNRKPFIHGMWTKIDLIKSGFAFDAEQVQDIITFNLALLFRLKTGQKYLWGYNFNGRLCNVNIDRISISDFNQFDQISVSDNITVMSTGQSVFYCGALLSIDSFDYDFSSSVSTPTQLDLQFTQINSWKFLNNTIIGISSAQNGFILRTNVQVFGVGQCVAFECQNFNKKYQLYSSNIQLLNWLTAPLIVKGGPGRLIAYIQHQSRPIEVNALPLPSDDPLTEFEYIQLSSSSNSNKSQYIITAVLIIDVLAIICISYISHKIRKYFKQRNEPVKVSFQGANPNEFIVPLPDYSVEAVNVLLSSNTQKWDDDVCYTHITNVH